MFTQKILLPLFVLVSVIAVVLAILLINQPVGANQTLFTGHEDHSITLKEGAELTKAFRVSTPSNAILAQYFGKEALQKTLEQPTCVGLRIYYGKHTDGSPTLVIVGVDANGNDIKNGHILQKAIPCPPLCGDTSPLKVDPTIASVQ